MTEKNKKSQNSKVGARGEKEAAKYLRKKGYKIVARNVHLTHGEIDIIARNSQYIVFVEVKYRTDEKSGNALESITKAKMRQISKTALFYMNQKKLSTDHTKIRFDVVGITGDTVTLIKNAFDFGV